MDEGLVLPSMLKRFRSDAVGAGLMLAMLVSKPLAAEMTHIGAGDLQVDACQIDLRTDDVRMFWRSPDGVILGDFDQVQRALLATHQNLLCASNGGIYGKDLHPIGMYVESGKLLHPLNMRKNGYGNFYMQPNGVFMLTDRGAAIMDTDALAAQWDGLAASVRYATQSGPILLQAGVINAAFTPGSGNRVIRNAACVKSPSEVILAKSRMPINFHDFAAVLRDAGCREALYLDGSVSALYPLDPAVMPRKFSVMVGVVVPAAARIAPLAPASAPTSAPQ